MTTTAVANLLQDLRQRGGLKESDVANIVDVSLATVSRWSSGAAMPPPQTQLLLSHLHYVVDRLADFYTPEEARVWLYAPHPMLSDERAIDLLQGRAADQVLAVIDRLDAGIYI